MISPECTFTQRPLRTTRSAGLRPVATSTSSGAISAQGAGRAKPDLPFLPSVDSCSPQLAKLPAFDQLACERARLRLCASTSTLAPPGMIACRSRQACRARTCPSAEDISSRGTTDLSSCLPQSRRLLGAAWAMLVDGFEVSERTRRLDRVLLAVTARHSVHRFATRASLDEAASRRDDAAARRRRAAAGT